MRIDKYIKILNNTELGKGTTHEYYVLVTGGYNVDNVFDSFINGSSVFVDKIDNTNIDNIRKQTGRETRIVGFGPYYRKYDLNAGDLLVLERIKNTDQSISFYLSNIKKTNNLVLQKVGNKGYEILTQNLAVTYPLIVSSCLLNDVNQNIEIRFKQSVRKRSDSPEPTDFYDIVIDGSPYNIGDKEMCELTIEQDRKIFKKLKTWNKYTVKW